MTTEKLPLSERQLLTVADAAELLSCTRSTMYGFVRSGRVLSVMLGGRTRIRIPRAALERLVEERAQGAGQHERNVRYLYRQTRSRHGR